MGKEVRQHYPRLELCVCSDCYKVKHGGTPALSASGTVSEACSQVSASQPSRLPAIWSTSRCSCRAVTGMGKGIMRRGTTDF